MRPQLLFPALGVLLMVMGWPMAARKVRPNRWYGLRVPATLADEGVWYDANAVAGRDMIVLGATLAASALVLPLLAPVGDEVYAAVFALLLGVGSAILAARGWRLANRLLRERHGRQGRDGDPRSRGA